MSLPEKPITRKEAYLAKIAGQDVPVPEWPLTREESYLAKIAGQTVSIPDKPITRVEKMCFSLWVRINHRKSTVFCDKLGL